jgi:hypothetical protein
MSRTRGNFIGVITTAQLHIKTNYQHLPLKMRLEELFKIREIYQNLKNVIEDIIARSANKSFLSTIDIETGYNGFKGINVLDLSKEGEEILART